MPESPNNRNAFGKLIRFWRNTLDLSQAQLAEKVEAAPRHISFLETGRSNPTREMVTRIAQALELGSRESSTLYNAAGFSIESAPIDINAPEHQKLKQTLGMLLQKHEPYPALVINHIGDIVLGNRAWQAMMEFVGLHDQLSRHEINLYHLYFSEEGLKQGIDNWEELACFLLLNIREKQILTGNSRLEELSQWLQAYPGLPLDWAKRIKGIRNTSIYDIHYDADPLQFSSRTLVTGVEPNRNETYSQLELHTFIPQNADTQGFWESLDLDNTPRHPLIVHPR
ncbi:MAG: helix-turn-helix domain-containing protein [Cellvibrionaceae bacterium]